MRKSFLFVALAALALVGCNDKTQSELTEDVLGLNGEAKVTVKFYYNEGTKLVDGVEVSETLPVPASCKVVAKVDYSEYTGAAKGESFKQFAATAKGNGVYEVVIPAGEKQITVDIIANGFTADYYLTPEKKIQAYYQTKTIADINNGVLAGQEVLEQNPTNTTLVVDPNIINNDRQVIIEEISGKLNGTFEAWNSDDYPETVKQGIAGREVMLVIEPKDKKADKRVLTYFTTTNKDGEFSFENVAIYDEWKDQLMEKDDTVTMKIKVEQWADEKFTHWYKAYDSSVGRKLWNDESDYKATWDGTYADRFGKDWDAWCADLAALKDGSDFLYAYSKNTTQDVLGSWKVADKAIADVKAVVTLFGKSKNNELNATFTPADLNDVYGAKSKETQMVQCDNKDKVEVPVSVGGNYLK